MINDWPCHRCGTDNVLAILRLPHTWTNASGNEFPVIREVHLCARCDAADPLAGPVVRYFAIGGSARSEDAAELSRDLLRWIDQARPSQVEPDESSGARSDWFVEPGGPPPISSA